MELIERFKNFYKWIQDPAEFYTSVHGETPYPYQAEILRSIVRNFKTKKRYLILAAAGTGKTKLLGTIALYFAYVLPKRDLRPYEVIIISGSLLQSRKVYEYTRQAIRSLNIEAETTSITQRATEFTNGSVIKALPNSPQAIYNQHGDLCLVDEASLIDPYQLNDTFRIVGANDGVVVWCGTPMYYDSLFVRKWEEENEKLNKGLPSEWTVYSWSVKDCPSPALQRQYESLKGILPEDQFSIFWEGKPYALKGALIPRDALVKAVRGIRPFKPREDWDIYFGIDWGWNSPTAVAIVQTDGERYEVLEVLHWSETDFDLINSIITARAKLLSPKRIFTDAENKSENLRLLKQGLPVQEIAFNKERQLLLSRLRDLFIKERIFIPETPEFKALIDELRVATWEKNPHQDLVEALMLSCRETHPKNASPVKIFHARALRKL